MTCQPGAVRAGAFDPHPTDRAERLEPRHTTRGSRPASSRTTRHPTRRRSRRPPLQHERPRACPLHPSPGACSLRWSSPSLLSQTVKGWHARPGKETVTSTLLEQRTRSPSGTGRAQFRTHANNQRVSDPNVPVTTTTAVDPLILTGRYGVPRVSLLVAELPSHREHVVVRLLKDDAALGIEAEDRAERECNPLAGGLHRAPRAGDGA